MKGVLIAYQIGSMSKQGDRNGQQKSCKPYARV
jgi:hypothetical protein